MDWITEEGYAETMRDRVEPALAEIRREEDVPVRGGVLHTEIYEPAGAERNLLLLHGFTESAEKFREMIWYFTQAGFRVVAPDQRGHGRSTRLHEDTSLTDVERFSDYADDAETLMDTDGLFDKDLRSVLYGHSMGGAVAGGLLLRRPAYFSRAVLSSPMVAPSSAPLPMWLGKLCASACCLFGQKEKRAFIGKPYDPEAETFETSYDTSRARFSYYAAKRMARRELQNTSPTYRWVKNAVGVTRTLLNREAASRVETPVLICQAGRETVVLCPQMDAFAALLKDARIRRFESAKHEIYLSEDAVLREYAGTVVAFLKEA